MLVNQQTLYKLATNYLTGLGPVGLRKTLAKLGNIEALFKESLTSLEALDGLTPKAKLAFSLREKAVQLAELEMKQVQKANIQLLWYTDDKFPHRLNQCHDAPCLLFHKGNTNFNSHKILSVVGARNANKNALEHCEKLIAQLRYQKDLLIVSGLAYGSDITAHIASHQNNIPTLAVLAHGLQEVYPSAHANWARQFQDHGGICTDFHYGMPSKPGHFPRRNRIVAGLSDATLVIDSKVNGGSMITANLAFSYAREVLAFPSAAAVGLSGTNQLIKTHRASLVENAEDIINALAWDKNESKLKTMHKQPELQLQLNDMEQKLYSLLNAMGKTHIDVIAAKTGLSQPEFSMDLLNLEFKGVLQSLPGDYYNVIK